MKFHRYLYDKQLRKLFTKFTLCLQLLPIDSHEIQWSYHSHIWDKTWLAPREWNIHVLHSWKYHTIAHIHFVTYIMAILRMALLDDASLFKHPYFIRNRAGVITYRVLEERAFIHMLMVHWLYQLQLIPCMNGNEYKSFYLGHLIMGDPQCYYTGTVSDI